MVQSLGHLVVAGVLAGLTVLAVRTWLQSRRSYTLIVVLIGVGLVYDNAVLGAGRWLGHSELLETLSLPRFALHAFSTPLLIIVGFGALRTFGIGWAQRRGPHVAACLLATGLVAWGVVTDLVLLDLAEQRDAGVVSYGNAAGSAPVPAIATIVALIVAGVWLWRTAGWRWLALGATAMLVASGLGGISGLLTNLGELSLVGALVSTEHRAGQLVARRPAVHRFAATSASESERESVAAGRRG